MHSVRLGSRVIHPRFGEGTVVALVVGYKAKVRFDARPTLPRTFLQRDLKPTDRAELALSAEAAGAPAAHLPKVANLIRERITTASSEERSDARQAMEAIPLGVVPSRCARDYTVARDAALASFDALLESRRGMRVLWGDYGAGKTHLLDVIETTALERQFVTSRIALGPDEAPPSQPQRLFRALVTLLRLPDGAGVGLLALLERLVESADHHTPDGKRFSRFFSPYLWAQHRHDEGAAALMSDYLLGEPTDPYLLERGLRRVRWPGPKPLVLSDFRTYGRVYLHLFGVLAAWCKDAGYRGLLLLLDEVEYVEGQGTAEAERAQDVLDHFAASTIEPEELGFDPEGLYKGGQAVHRALPLRFDDDHPLAVVLAATPLPEIWTGLHSRYRAPHLDVLLTPLVQADLVELVKRIFLLYRVAYPDYRPEDQLVRGIASALSAILERGENSTRALVRATVALCDRARIFGSLDA